MYYLVGYTVNRLTENIRSDTLYNLRQIIEHYSQLDKYIGSIFQLRLVIDSNAVISDLLWMVKRKKEDNKTAIIEVIQAGTLIAYAPNQLINEIEEHLPKIAKKKKISLEKMKVEWLAYQNYLEFVEIDEDKLAAYEDSADPKDAPFVILSEMLNVVGVMSDDPHIEQLGGKRIHLDIRLSLRDYSRSAAIAFSLRIGGVVCSHISIGILLAMGKGIKTIAQAIFNLPEKIRIILFFALIFVFLMPSVRVKVLSYLQSVKGLQGDIWEKVGPVVTDLIIEASVKGKEAEVKLEEIQSHLVS